MPNKSILPKHLIAAMLVGLAYRVLLAWRFAGVAGDSLGYEQLARNLVDHHIYGFFQGGHLVSADYRMPGYPMFLASVYSVFGRGRFAVRLAQAMLDTITCILIALMALRLAPEHYQKRAATVAIWLAALCPFTASYTRIILTETLAIFLTALALVLLVVAFGDDDRLPTYFKAGIHLSPWFVGGFIIGLGTLVRPETPVLAIAALIALSAQCYRNAARPRFLRAGLWMTLGLILPLAPWAVRNRISLGEVRVLAPRHAEVPGQFVPSGFYDWTRTWLFQSDPYGQKLDWEGLYVSGSGPVPILAEQLPDSAFDSGEELRHVVSLFATLNREGSISAEIDSEFGRLARERTTRKPLRTYLWIPILRATTMWLIPVAPQEGRTTKKVISRLLVVMLHFTYIALAIAALWCLRGHPAIGLLLIFPILRTVAMVQVPWNPEPRYLLECFSEVLALAAIFCAEFMPSSFRSLFPDR